MPRLRCGHGHASALPAAAQVLADDLTGNGKLDLVTNPTPHPHH